MVSIEPRQLPRLCYPAAHWPTYRGAGLDVEFAHGRAVVHGVEGGDLVDAHGGHVEDARHLVHDADAGHEWAIREITHRSHP